MTVAKGIAEDFDALNALLAVTHLTDAAARAPLPGPALARSRNAVLASMDDRAFFSSTVPGKYQVTLERRMHPDQGGRA